MNIGEHEYRIKQMNAIELLALRSQIDFNNYESSLKLYNILLEKVEVKAGDRWIQVKDGNIFVPAGIENDFKTVEALIEFVLEYLKSVFMKSND